MKTIFIIFFICFGLTCQTASAQDYAVKLISPELLQNAHMVKRVEEMTIIIKDPGNATLYHKYALTILNEAASEAAGISVPYDKLVNIEHMEGVLYDAAGKKIRSLKKSDIQDISGTSEASLADDNRLKQHNFNCNIYPYTVEYETTVNYKGIFYFPQWIPVEDENYSVEKSKLLVECPLDYNLRYKAFNYGKEPVISNSKHSRIYEWSIEKFPAVLEEPYRPEWQEITPAVILAPVHFEIQGYKGDMNNWKEFGKFIYSLNLNRDILPPAIKQKVHELTDAVVSPKDKIKVLYEYLQKNTRYVSIQLGLGGWQTFDAGYVASKGYGDCKALSNYMFSLLKEAGVRSFYTLIKAGDNNDYFMDDFPSNQFNHIIICVPQEKDSTWLECTSQTMPAGYLGGFTAGRSALLVDENGGTLVHTPVYNKKDNLQVRQVTAEIDNEGKLTAYINTSYRAQQQDDLHGMLAALSKEKIAEYLKEQLNLPSYDVTKFDYKKENGRLPVIREQLEITANNYATITGKRLFINPNLLNKTNIRITNPSERKFDFKLPYDFVDTDSVEIKLPEGYKPESVPLNISLETKFGSYKCSYKIQKGKIIYCRNIERNGGHYPISDAIALADFFERIYKADRAKIVLVRE